MSKRPLEQIEINGEPSKRSRSAQDALNTMSSSSNQPPKKLVISLRQSPVVLAADFEQKRWNALKESIMAVHASKKTQWTLQELYSAVEDLVEHGRGAWLYNVVEVELNSHISLLRDRLKNVANASSGEFLALFNSIWSSFSEQMILIRQIFLVLDRRFVLSQPALKPLWDLSLHLFSALVFGDAQISSTFTKSVIDLIETDRNRKQIDRFLLRSMIRMLSSLRLYERLFESPLIVETKRYFSISCESYLSEHSISEYLSFLTEQIASEKARGETLFESTTTNKVLYVFYSTAVKSHSKAIVERGLDVLLDAASLPDLSILYNLLEKVGSLPELTTAWNSYVKKKGASIVNDTSREANLIEDLLSFKGKVDSALEGPFKRSDSFSYALKEGMEHVVNLRTNVVAELLAKFIDSKLRSGKSSRSVSEADLEPMLDRLIHLFRYIGSKDVFEAFFKKDLAKRLLLNKSLSIDIEKMMIGKLKAECGANYTSKLEGMFKDMELSEELMVKFKGSVHFAPLVPQRLDARVLVLTTGFWPTYSTNSDAYLPKQLLDHQNAYNTFYSVQYAGRKLQWQNSLSHCVLKANFSGSKQKLELHLSLYQAIALLCFESENFDSSSVAMAFKHLMNRTQMDRAELIRALKSMSRKQLPILLRNGDESVAESAEQDETTFALNEDFKSKTLRVHVNAIQVKEGAEERSKTNEGVTKERIYALDAAIVRVMKARKTLTHSELIQEVIRAVGGRFTPQPSDIKGRVESLIEREFVKRDESNQSVFHYLA